MPSDPQRGPFEARFSDGRTAASYPITASFGPSGLVLSGGGSQVVIWPYAALGTGVPLGKRTTEVLVTCRDRPGARVFVPSATFASDLKERAPHLTAGAERWSILKRALPVTVVVAAAISSLWVFDLHPAQGLARLMPERAREAVGKQVLASLTQNRRVCETTASRQALDRLVGRLTRGEAGRQAHKVQIVDWPLVNAFAVPGGQVILTRGLIQQAASADEVAGVLAHEIGHSIELHPETALIRGIGLTAGAQLVFTGQPGTLANVGIILTQLNYTRSAEREADRHALRLLKDAQISPKGLLDFFERMEGKRPTASKDAGQEKDKGKVSTTRIPGMDVLRTHPGATERTELIKALAQYPATPALAEDEWNALRNACGSGPQRVPVPPATQQSSTPAPTPPPPPPPSKQAGPAPTGPAPTATAPTSAGPAPSTPATTAPLATGPASTGPASTGPATTGPVAAGPATTAPATSGPVVTGPATTGPATAAPAPLPSTPPPPAANEATDKTIADATAKLKSNPSDVAALQARGRAYLQKREFEPARADFAKAVETKPTDAALHFDLGRAHQALRRNREAVDDYSRAIERNPRYAGAYNNRGNVQRSLQQNDAALADYNEAIRLNPRFVAALNNRALVYRETDRLPEALTDLAKAIEIDPTYAAAYANRGLIHEKTGSRALAVENFRTALAQSARHDNTPWAHRTARERLAALGEAAP